MIRTLLTTTALVAVLSTGALAQSQTANKSDDMTVGVTVFSTDSDLAPMQSQNGYFSAMPGQVLASTLIGKTIYNGHSSEAEALGDVNDVVLSPNGNAEAIVIGVGGFLGIGEKAVAVDFERVNWSDVDGEKRLTMVASKEELENAPEFDTTVITSVRTEMNQNDAASPARTTGQTTLSTNSETPAQVTSETPAAVDLRAGMTPVDRSTVSVDNLLGVTVYGANNESIGEIGDVILGADNKVEAYIVDVGGFLGMGEKPVALDGSSLDIVKDADGDLRVHTPFTEEQLTANAAYSPDSYRTDRNSVILR